MIPACVGPWSDAEVAVRRPVWQAVSELFLDGSLEAEDIVRIARQLARSPYTLAELDRILLWEVYPACWWNVYSIAGEWAGFDSTWLERRIRRGPSYIGKAWVGSVGRLSVYSSGRWRRIKSAVVRIRATGS